MEIGQKIKEARSKKGITQEELGSIVGVQKSAIAKYENGKVKNIKRSVLAKIASVLDMDPADLIFESAPESEASFHSKVLSDSELMEMVKDYYSLKRSDQLLALAFVKRLASGGI